MALRRRLGLPLFPRLRQRLARLVAGSMTVTVGDGPGWGQLSSRPHERQWGEIQELYADTLEAWRKNPLAKRAVDVTADFVIGDGIRISSSFDPLQKYIEAFWNHRKNQMGNRLQVMCNELSLAGDLFPVLFTNPFDGLSYVRFVTKDRIVGIETARNDWETEIAFTEMPRWQLAGVGMAQPDDGDLEPILWKGVDHPGAGPGEGVMLHYAVNRPLGALMGEGDLSTMVPWLLRYSRMLEDRVRLNAAVRSFLWFVTVRSDLVEKIRNRYSSPPEPGSVVVKDEAEEWDVLTPDLRGSDAQHDLEAVRRMVYTGSGFPPHWFGEPGSNLAEARAMQNPAERHLLRRQEYFVYVLQDLLYQGYRRAQEVVSGLPELPSANYNELFAPAVPDVSREDNADLANAAETLTKAWRNLIFDQEPQSRTLTETLLTHFFRFMGEPQEASKISQMVDEIFAGVEREL